MKHLFAGVAILLAFGQHVESVSLNDGLVKADLKVEDEDGLPSRWKEECPKIVPSSGERCGSQDVCDYDYKRCPDGSGGHATHAHCVSGSWRIAHTLVHCAESDDSKQTLEKMQEPDVHILKKPEGANLRRSSGRSPQAPPAVVGRQSEQSCCMRAGCSVLLAFLASMCFWQG
eukprot:TRINITY_DN421_c0_g1_i1.p1 TRINITY_DN421_c0_g1~~TRINITY_DN421_c0_g1_i1.p1  ORF type:complete len:173 (-),score=20.22 TRINITY_DN421_c0_g1_i1:224-742(-)